MKITNNTALACERSFNENLLNRAELRRVYAQLGDLLLTISKRDEALQQKEYDLTAAENRMFEAERKLAEQIKLTTRAENELRTLALKQKKNR